MTSRDEIEPTIAIEIERYLADHPDGADSAEGIRDWWLPRSLREKPLSVVISALKTLECRGVITKTQLEGVGAIYSSATRKTRKLH